MPLYETAPRNIFNINEVKIMSANHTNKQSGSNTDHQTETHQESFFEVQINTENAAFEDSGEIARILRDLADRIEGGSIGGKIRDINGNAVGTFKSEK